MADINWTVEEAWAAQEAALDANPDLIRGPLYQWDALHKLERLKKQDAAGDRVAVIEAIFACAMDDLVIPRWAADAFIKSYYSVLTCRSGSWDEAFGRPFPKNTQLKAARRRRELRFRVFSAVERLLDQPTPPALDAALFEEVGASFGIKKTLCASLYYEAGKYLGTKKLPRVF